jgi:hypothetical protein
MKKRIYRAAVSQMLRNTGLKHSPSVLDSHGWCIHCLRLYAYFKQRLLYVNKNSFQSSSYAYIMYVPFTSHTINRLTGSSCVAISTDTHVGLNVATHSCNVYPDKCWFAVFCRFWLQCSRTLRADSHIACRAHAVPLPCRAAKGLECVFPIWFTHCGRVWFTLHILMNQTRPHCVNQMGKDTF